MEEKNARVITISDFWNTFIWHWIPIVLAAVFSISAVYIYARFIRKPVYRSTAALYILRQEREPEYAYTSSDFTLALNVVNDCDYMLKSHAVLDEVMYDLDLEMDYKKLARSISTNNPEGSRVLEVSVVTDSPQLAKRIVDSVCRIGTEKISAAMGFNQVNVYEYGTVSDKPSNQIGLRRYALIGISSSVLVYLAYLVALILDDKIKTEDDVHKYLKLSVLGNIPNADAAASSNGKYGRYSRYSRKGKYGKYYSYGVKGIYGTEETKQVDEGGK